MSDQFHSWYVRGKANQPIALFPASSLSSPGVLAGWTPIPICRARRHGPMVADVAGRSLCVNHPVGERFEQGGDESRASRRVADTSNEATVVARLCSGCRAASALPPMDFL